MKHVQAEIIDASKAVAVVVGNDIHDLLVRPGTTKEDVLNQIGLPADYQLSLHGHGEIGSNDVLFDVVQHGSKIFANPPVEVGVKP